ncbi:MAG: winged helix DNA-binding protein [Vulcanimicrobiota bacterium]
MPGVPPSKNRLSRRQEQILFFIRESVESRGFPPSIREIGEAVGLSSSSTVHAHLRSLESKGYLKRNPSKPRSIELLDVNGNRPRLVDLPVSPAPGTLSESVASDNGQRPERTLSLPMELAGSRESFLFTVEKNYRHESIVTGDMVIVNRAAEASRGDMVLTRGPQGVDLTRLASPPEDPAAILGRVVGVIRKLDNA